MARSGNSQSPTAPYVYGPKLTKPKRATSLIPDDVIQKARSVAPQHWDAQRHLGYEPPAKIHTMKDIGLEGHGISPVAVSDPFPLFTNEAILQMRREVLSEAVLEHCRFSSPFFPNVIRGMGYKYVAGCAKLNGHVTLLTSATRRAPFTLDAWYSPELLERISIVAGIKLVPLMEQDVGVVNISIGDTKVDTATTGDVEKVSGVSATAWHYDSVPFVCVTMLSDCSDMIGGETAIKLPNGDVRNMRGPTMGTAVVMQGRYIQHQALKAFGGRERFAMVTSFRAKSPFVRDETVLTGMKGISNLEELYSQFSQYRLEILEERFRGKLKEEQQRVGAGKLINLARLREFLFEQKCYLEQSIQELYDVDELVG